MVKKIGNSVQYLFLLFFSFSCLAAPLEVFLRIVNEQGTPVKKTGVGIPVVMEIILKGTSQLVDSHIEGIHDFQVDYNGATKQVSTINGVTTTKTISRYMIRTQKEGSYTIGPVQVAIDGTTYRSSTVPLEVERGYNPASAAEQKIGFEIIADKTNAVVGEKISLRVRFYEDSQRELLEIESLQLKDCKATPLQGPSAGVEERHGMPQRYVEWQTDIIPQKPGELTIPALKALYQEQSNAGRSQLDFFAGFLGLGFAKKYVYSNSLVLTIDPLPPFAGTVNAVGSFTSLRAKLNQSQAKQGEGVVLTLELEGEGALDAIPHPVLQMPEALSCYDSKATVGAAGTTKIFEYIVQGKEPGAWNIPAQEFIFFDVRDRMYKVLHTAELPITILSGANKAREKMEEKPMQPEASSEQQIPLFPLAESSQRAISVHTGFPLSILLVGFLLPLLLILIRTAYWYRTRDTLMLKKRQAFSQARASIQRAAAHHTTALLYEIFVTFIADRYCLVLGESSRDLIRQRLGKVSPAASTQWETFVTKLSEHAYGDVHATLQEKEELCKSALMWLTLFQKSEQL